MRCPILAELPPPPPGKTGWPWTEESPQLPPFMLNGETWPKISIVTPSYNQGQFIEATIRSVLLQGYPNLEYFVMDGGSNDNSLDVIKKYEKWITGWISEQDRGQSHAINKGINRSTGDIFNWLNSDDQLALAALKEIGRLWAKEKPDLLIGRGLVINFKSGQVVHDWYARPPKKISQFTKSNSIVIPQPSTFLKLSLLKQLGGVKENLTYIMDWELYLRLTAHMGNRIKTSTTKEILSIALDHPATKTNQGSNFFRKEELTVISELATRLPLGDRLHLLLYQRRIIGQNLITKLLISNPRSPEKLLRLLLHLPELLWSRFFWGALRREIGLLLGRKQLF